MNWLKRLSLALAAGVANGALFYMVGAVAETVSPAISPEVAFAVGFGSAVAISLTYEYETVGD